MLGFSLVVLAETSAEGGETLKVCWSCVDLPRPLETQTIFSISPGSTQLILFFSFAVLSCIFLLEDLFQVRPMTMILSPLLPRHMTDVLLFSSALATKSKL